MLKRLGVETVAIAAGTRQDTFSGEFSEAGNLLNHEIGRPSNYEILYLFSDGMYLFAESGDILPRIIFERGTWEWGGGLLRLRSDGSIPQNRRQRAARDLLPFFLPMGGTRKLMLINSGEGLNCLTSKPLFERSQLAGRVVAYNCMLYRKTKLSARAGRRLRAELMRDSWNPAWYQDAVHK
jgi:hypothetical protein